MYVVIIGDLDNGFKIVGPFESFDSAAECADNYYNSWIKELIEPRNKNA